MTMFVIQAFLLIAIAFVLGAVAGALLRQLLGDAKTSEAVSRDRPPASVKKTEPEKRPAKPATPTRKKPEPKPTDTAASRVPKPEVQKDNLKRINGIGPQNEKALNALGIYNFKQIASWSPAQEEEMGEKLAFPGRIEREEWVSQAKALAQGKAPVSKAPAPKRLSRDGPTKTTGQIKSETAGSKPQVLAKPPAGGGDDLALVEGIGQALQKKLNGIGIYTFKQIAGWSAEEQAWIGNAIGFPGRPEREDWVKEAASLSKSSGGKKRATPARGEITAKRKTVIR